MDDLEKAIAVLKMYSGSKIAGHGWRMHGPILCPPQGMSPEQSISWLRSTYLYCSDVQEEYIVNLVKNWQSYDYYAI